jgi:hypothetical protein
VSNCGILRWAQAALCSVLHVTELIADCGCFATMTYIQDYLPPGRNQLMKSPRPRLNGRNKGNSLHHNPSFDSAPSLRDRHHSSTVPALPTLSYPLLSSRHYPQASLYASPISSSSVHSAPPSPPSSAPSSKRRCLPRLTPTSVVLRKSRIAAVQLSSPNSCAIVFRAVRFPPVAFFNSRYMVA